MASLTNPYLSPGSQNLLIKRNFNVIKSPNKEPLFTNYINKDSAVSYSQKYKLNRQSTAGNESSLLSGNTMMRNVYSTRVLGQKNQNLGSSPFTLMKSNYSKNLPSFYTQPYLPSLQKNELPFPSYNRPQSYRSSSRSLNKYSNQLSLSRRNVAVLNGQSTSLQKSSGSYRPYFVYPLKNNDWNTQKWKKQLQHEERQKLRIYGLQAIRYQNNNYKSSLNNEYYSIKQLEDKKYSYKINSQNPNQRSNRNQKKQYQDEFLYKKDNYTLKEHDKQNQNRKNSLDIPKNPDGISSQSSLLQKKHKVSLQNNNHVKNRVSFDQQLNYHKQGQLQQSEVQNFQNRIQNFTNNDNQNFMKNSKHFLNQSSMMDDYKSFVKNQQDSEFHGSKYQSKYQQNHNGNNRKSSKGPLSFDAFDSGGEDKDKQLQKEEYNFNTNGMMDSKSMKNYNSGRFGSGNSNLRFREEESSVMNNQHEKRNTFGGRKKDSFQTNLIKPQKDYPQIIKHNNHLFHRIKVA